LLGGKDTMKARSQEGGGPKKAESCSSNAKSGDRKLSQSQKPNEPAKLVKLMGKICL
jgi:hypothetical protein